MSRESQLQDHLQQDAAYQDKALKEAKLIEPIIAQIEFLRVVTKRYNSIDQISISMKLDSELLQPLADYYDVHLINNCYINLQFDGYIDFNIEKI